MWQLVKSGYMLRWWHGSSTSSIKIHNIRIYSQISEIFRSLSSIHYIHYWQYWQIWALWATLAFIGISVLYCYCSYFWCNCKDMNQPQNWREVHYCQCCGKVFWNFWVQRPILLGWCTIGRSCQLMSVMFFFWWWKLQISLTSARKIDNSLAHWMAVTERKKMKVSSEGGDCIREHLHPWSVKWNLKISGKWDSFSKPSFFRFRFHALSILTPQKCLFWEPRPLLYRFQPLHWRVQGSLGC